MTAHHYPYVLPTLAPPDVDADGIGDPESKISGPMERPRESSLYADELQQILRNLHGVAHAHEKGLRMAIPEITTSSEVDLTSGWYRVRAVGSPLDLTINPIETIGPSVHFFVQEASSQSITFQGGDRTINGGSAVFVDLANFQTLHVLHVLEDGSLTLTSMVPPGQLSLFGYSIVALQGQTASLAAADEATDSTLTALASGTNHAIDILTSDGTFEGARDNLVLYAASGPIAATLPALPLVEPALAGSTAIRWLVQAATGFPSTLVRPGGTGSINGVADDLLLEAPPADRMHLLVQNPFGSTVVTMPTYEIGHRVFIKHNHGAGSAPTSSDDASAGYSIGSQWIDASDAYVCISPAAGAAVWKKTTP